MGRHPTPFRMAALGSLLAAGFLAGCAQGVDHLPPAALAADPGTTGALGPAPTSERATKEARSSGHPAMSPDAVRDAAAKFPACIAGLWPQAERRGISRASFTAHTANLTPDLRILELLDRQPEFTKSFWDYLDMLVTEKRIARGREILAEHRPAFDAVERSYGVDRHVIAAIWGIESNFGASAGNRPVLRSTATLACIGRRQAYFRDEFLAALEILHRGDLRPDQLRGSWAGAFGPTQFMPTSFQRHAVDFDGDGRRNVVGSVPDLIASTANLLHKAGWRSGETWGYEVVVPDGFDYLLADRSRVMTVRAWEQRGIRRVEGRSFPRPEDRGYLLVPAGAQGPGFIMLENFRAVMKYNPSEAYALAIGHLADRLRGGETFVQAWPRHERVLSRSERIELQRHLARRGYDVGEPDGRLGSKTRTALRTYQQRSGKVPDGFASASVLSALRRL
jgi:membrane-bound lytic murein transglycosylase B